MHKEELLLFKNLEKLGFIVDYNKKKCKMYSILCKEYYVGFYDHRSCTLKKYLNIDDSGSPVSVMNSKHLIYRLSFLTILANKLGNLKSFQIGNEEDMEMLRFDARQIALKLKMKFKQETGITPFRDFINVSGISKIEDVLTRSLINTNNLSNGQLMDNINTAKEELKEKLPKMFNEKISYGVIIGIFVKEFYGFNSSELIEVLARRGVKTSNKNLVELLNNEHLKYYYTGINFINKYKDYYKLEEYNLFLEQVRKMAKILKNKFVSQVGVLPLDNLININKKNNQDNEQVTFDDIVRVRKYE